MTDACKEPLDLFLIITLPHLTTSVCFVYNTNKTQSAKGLEPKQTNKMLIIGHHKKLATTIKHILSHTDTQTYPSEAHYGPAPEKFRFLELEVKQNGLSEKF